jgi:hypothetical protein
MKAKTLLLAVAAVAAAVSTQAQVYSVNAVGYVNRTLKPGYNLVANPLNAADNTIGSVFMNFQGGPKNGTIIYKLVGSGFQSSRYDDLDGFYSGQATTLTVVPGEGVYVLIPGTEDKTITFVGEVVQGPTSTPLPRGFSIKSSVVPQAVKPDALGAGSIPAANGDIIYRYNTTTKGFDSYRFDDLDGTWSHNGVAGLPVFDVGEAFYYLRVGAATNWTRTFSVNNPT